MSYYKVCPYCGANLDPGELCDCLPALRAEARRCLSRLTREEAAEVMEPIMKELARGVGSATGDEVEQSLADTVSASIVTQN